jgi:exonuclease SbcC
MIFNRLLKPKWQHSNPRVRKQAIQGLDPSNPVLVQMIRQDRNPEVRQEAVGKVEELGLLQQVAEQDADPEVREAAVMRVRTLMAGEEPGPLSLETRLAFLEESTLTELLEFLARRGQESALRLAAIGRIMEEAPLTEVAIDDPSAEVRLAALERIHQPERLEQVVRQSRNRDKRVYRSAKERLDILKAQRNREERLEQLCVAMESLVWDGDTGPNAGRFPKLEKEWRELKAHADAGLGERYRRSRERFLARRQESNTRRMAKLDICIALEKFKASLEGEVELTEEVAKWVEDTLRSHRETWGQQGASDDLEGRRLEGRYQELLQAIEGHRRLLHRSRQRAEHLREVLRAADKLLHQASEVREADISDLKHRWGSLEHPESKGLALELQRQFDTAVEKLHTRIHRQLERRDQELQEIMDLIDALERALEEGKLQQSICCYDKARDRVQSNIGLSRQRMTELETRLHACVPKLNELRGWRRWGTQQAREHLCEAAEALIGLEDDPRVVARRIQAVRSTWKTLDHTEGAASKTLWKRFDQACKQAYEPCQAYFDSQSKERETHLEQKQAICKRLEELEATTDWDQVDWREADRLRRRLQEQWRRTGPVNHADRKRIERRYHGALKRLDRHLNAERERDLERRRTLVEQVEALVDSDDLSGAIEFAKRAQGDWRPTVQASRREEQALWKRFRAACDGVFQRRQAEREALDQGRQDNLARKTALRDEIETLAIDDADAIRQARRRIEEIRREWAAIGPVPKSALPSLEQHFSSAQQGFEARLKAAERAKAAQALRGLRERARLCDAIEARLEEEELGDAETVVAGARRMWETLPDLEPALAEPLQARFDTVCHALVEGGATAEVLRQTLRGNLEKKQNLCLHVEILAGVESPPEFAQQRMEFQVSRLSAAFNGGDLDQAGEPSPDEMREVRLEWCLTGLLPATRTQALEARFERALATFDKV